MFALRDDDREREKAADSVVRHEAALGGGPGKVEHWRAERDRKNGVKGPPLLVALVTESATSKEDRKKRQTKHTQKKPNKQTKETSVMRR